jgi:hypothetical protein
MDLDDHLIKFDNADKDGAMGYDGTGGDDDGGLMLRDNDPNDGTMNWVQHWNVTFNEWIEMDEGHLNLGDADPNLLYRQWMCCGYNPDIPLCAITDSIFYNVKKYSESDDLGVSNDENVWCNRKVSVMPIQALTRGAVQNLTTTGDEGTKYYSMAPVTWINPCAAADALTNTNCYSCCRNCCDRDNAVMPEYVGGFSGCYNWLECWTAADAFGLTDTSMNDQNGDINCDGTTDLEDLAELADDYLL